MRNSLRRRVFSKGLFNVNQEWWLCPDASAWTVGLCYSLQTPFGLPMADTRWKIKLSQEKEMIAPFPKMGLCTNNSRTRIAFWGFSGIVKFVEMREIIYSPQTQFSRLPSLPVLPVIARSMWWRQRGVIPVSLLLFSLPKCPDFCWCNVLEAEVEGKQRADGNHAALCSFVHMGHSRSLHFSETNPKKLTTSDMVSQQGWGKKKRNEKNRTASDTGNSLTFVPGPNLTPIMCFASVYLPTF